MITEDYVSFETAKLLKEKGFNEYCRAFRSPSSKGARGLFYSVREVKNTEKKKTLGAAIACPTLQMTIKWLIEVHNIIPIVLTGDNKHNGVAIYYWFRIDTIKNGVLEYAIYKEDKIEYPAYEEAAEAAIKYCLEYLIN